MKLYGVILFLLMASVCLGEKKSSDLTYPITTADGQSVLVTDTALNVTWDLYLKSTTINQQVTNLDGSVTVLSPRIHTGGGGYFSKNGLQGICQLFKLGDSLGSDSVFFGYDPSTGILYQEVYVMGDDGTVEKTDQESSFVTSVTCKGS